MKNTTKKAVGKRREPRTVAELETEQQIDRELEMQRRKKRAAQPEPEDTTSDEWRYWKIANLTLAFTGADRDAYARAHAEFRALLTGLYHDEDFWHVTNALHLLPHLIIARQKIEKMERVETQHDSADEASEPQPTNDELQRGKAFDYRGDDNPIPRLTWKRAEELADIIVAQDEDEIAAAFIELITGIAYERDHIERDNTASSAARVAFSRTFACNDGLNAFSDAACMRVAPQHA
jgi:hypothetical protein